MGTPRLQIAWAIGEEMLSVSVCRDVVIHRGGIQDVSDPPTVLDLDVERLYLLPQRGDGGLQ